jgi:hypothetical protein
MFWKRPDLLVKHGLEVTKGRHASSMSFDERWELFAEM